MTSKKKWICLCTAAFLVVIFVLVAETVRMQDSPGDGVFNEVSEASGSAVFDADNVVSDGRKGRVSSSPGISAEPVPDLETQNPRTPKPQDKSGTKQQSKSDAKDQRKTEIKQQSKAKAKQRDTGKKVSQKKTGKSFQSSGKKSGQSKKPAASAPPVKRAEEVSLDISCKSIMDKQDLWKDGVEEILPKDGVFFSGRCRLQKGDSVYDILKRVCGEKGIALDAQYTPVYGTYYIRGIGNLYEFDCGGESGWKYKVNGVVPGVGCSGYRVKNGDDIRIYYDYQY